MLSRRGRKSLIEASNKKPSDSYKETNKNDNRSKEAGNSLVWALMIGCCLLIIWVIDGISEYKSDLSLVLGIGVIIGAAYVIKISFQILRTK